VANRIRIRSARSSEALLAAYVNDEPVAHEELREGLAAQTRRAKVHPVFFGSARTGAGVDALIAGIAEQDPLINLRQDERRGEISVSLYGEVQKEVIQAMLASDFGVDVTFRETTTICIERPIGTGAAFDIIDTDPNPYLATVGLRVDPAPIDSGVEFRLEVELGPMPLI